MLPGERNLQARSNDRNRRNRRDGRRNFLENQFKSLHECAASAQFGFNTFVRLRGGDKFGLRFKFSRLHSRGFTQRREKKFFTFGTDAYSPGSHDVFNKVALREALYKSKNVGNRTREWTWHIGKVMNHNQRTKPVCREIKAYPSDGTGNSEVTPLPMATTYARFSPISAIKFRRSPSAALRPATAEQWSRPPLENVLNRRRLHYGRYDEGRLSGT